MKHAIDLKRAYIAGPHLIAANDPRCSGEGEGRNCPMSDHSTRDLLTAPPSWLLVAAGATLAVLAIACQRGFA